MKNQSDKNGKIDREAVVKRNSPQVTAIDSKAYDFGHGHEELYTVIQ